MGAHLPVVHGDLSPARCRGDVVPEDHQLATQTLTETRATRQSEQSPPAGLSSNPERSSDHSDVVEARRELRALRLEDHVKRVLADAPPLTDESRSHIAALLRLGGGFR